MGEFWYRSGRLSLNSTVVMGILNVTPDSFSDGGRYASPEKALEHALEMQAQGAGILDVGAQSTRPGHVPVSPEEEWARLEPVLDRLRGRIRIPISVDTYYPAVAKAALVSGADILNDVSGDLHNGMMELAAETGAGLVVMHAGGGADDVGAAGADVVETVRRFFEEALARAAEVGLDRNRICLDPGIGFGKTREGDRRLVSSLPRLMLDLPDAAVLVGASRKRVVGDCAGKPVPLGERLPGTLAFHSIAQWNGARILRVHDVAEAVRAAAVVDELMREGADG